MSSSRSKSAATRSAASLGWTRSRLLLAVVPLLLLAATYAFATIDIRNHDGRVLRGVQLGQVDVGGMDSEELDRELDRINSFVVTAPVYIETPGAAYQIDAERLGLTLDRSKTRAAILGAGREGNGLLRPFGWLGAIFSKREVDAVLRLDPAAAEAGLAAVSKTISVQPGEPTLTLRNDRLILEPGTAGSILDVSQLVRDLSASLPTEAGQEITVNAVTTSDAMVDVEIQSLVDRINGSTTDPIELIVDGASIRPQRGEFRSWVTLDLDGAEPEARLDADVMYRWINAAAGIAQGEIDTRALIVDGGQIRLPDTNAVMCCQAEVAGDVLEAVLSGQKTVELDLISDDLMPLAELGISEMLGEFTTRHPAGEDRVINIQRMADIVRGALIEPGGTFSLNDYVGERTTAKGFVPAGVIYDGVFDEDVGGGVSQFATTLFNASFFGGLDFVAYQAHSIYIDRYPYGREATVNWPGVDLKVRNPTDFPVLIWTEYTPNSITVKLFGTATVTGKETGQTEEDLDQCTKVRTERTRTFADGRTEIDYVGATYQPREGLGCDGLPTTPPPECDEGLWLVDVTDDGFGDLCVPPSELCPQPSVPVDEAGDGVFDFCTTEECPADATAIDTDDDGVLDQCVVDAENTTDENTTDENTTDENTTGEGAADENTTDEGAADAGAGVEQAPSE